MSGTRSDKDSDMAGQGKGQDRKITGIRQDKVREDKTRRSKQDKNKAG